MGRSVKTCPFITSRMAFPWQAPSEVPWGGSEWVDSERTVVFLATTWAVDAQWIYSHCSLYLTSLPFSSTHPSSLATGPASETRTSLGPSSVSESSFCSGAEAPKTLTGHLLLLAPAQLPAFQVEEFLQVHVLYSASEQPSWGLAQRQVFGSGSRLLI